MIRILFIGALLAFSITGSGWLFAQTDHSAIITELQKDTSLHAPIAEADGYKGIWFTLGQFSRYGDKYSGGLGTYTSSHIPVAIYSAKVNKTFFVYGGTTQANERHLLIMISYYDHSKKQVPRPVILYDKRGVDDPHDNASISIDEKGSIWVFVSGRNTSRPGLIFKSVKPFDLSAFRQVREAEMTYPQPWWVKGKGFFYLFTKYTNGRELYWSTSKDGTTWSPDQKLAGMGGHYQVSNKWKNKIVTAFNYHPGGNVDKRTNLYFLQTTDMGQSWSSVSGTAIDLPLTSTSNAALVRNYEAEGKLVYLNDINFDDKGNPIVLAVISDNFQPGPEGNKRQWVVIYWDNGNWQTRNVCQSSHNYDMGSLYIKPGLWQVIGPTERGPQPLGTGGEMAVWESTDRGQNWKMTRSLTSNSIRNHSYARRPSVMHPDFQAFWADGNADSLSISTLYFSASNGAVYQLPYEMKSKFEKPVLVTAKRN